MEKIDADGFQRVRLYDGKREHDIAVYDHHEQELYTYDENGAFEDDEGIDDKLKADVAEALGANYVEELDILTSLIATPAC